MVKKCLLISPPGELNVFPRGIMEIATFLNSQGVPCDVLPLGYYLKNIYNTDPYGYILQDLDKKEIYNTLQDKIEETNPELIGISNVYTRDNKSCLEIVSMCKQIRPQVLTVMGGQHATFCDKECLKNSDLDIIVRGEGEWTLIEILKATGEKKDFDQIPGITYRKNGSVHQNPTRSMGKLNKIPPVDFGLLPENYVRNTLIHGILNRGCAFHCKYCVEEKFWKNPRLYSSDKLIIEMKDLQDNYQTQMIGLEESMLDMRTNTYFSLLGKIKDNRIDLREEFYITTRIDTVTEQGIKKMKETNINILCVGIENFSDQVLKMMNKGQNYASILKGCEMLKNHNIWTNAYWMIGHPGDNPDNAEYTYSMFKEFFEKKLLKSGHVFVFVPYPGTEYFNHPEKYGIIINSYEWRKWRRWTKKPISCLENFSTDQVVTAYLKAREMLINYQKLNTFLYKSKKTDPDKNLCTNFTLTA